MYLPELLLTIAYRRRKVGDDSAKASPRKRGADGVNGNARKRVKKEAMESLEPESTAVDDDDVMTVFPLVDMCCS